MDIRQAIQLLELKSFSEDQDIKKQFYRLAHLYHPDKNPDEASLERFRLILDAYEYCLNHITEVSLFFNVQKKQESPKIETRPVKSTISDDIFEDIFGYSQNGRILGFQEPQKIDLTIAEFALGITKIQKLVAYRRCKECDGIGAPKGQSVKLCRYCFGQGTISKKSQPKKYWQACPQCQGRGKLILHPCSCCDGFGRLRQVHLQKFSLPVGMQPYRIYSLESLDLVTNIKVQIFIEPHLAKDKVFQIENYDLVCQYPVELNKISNEISTEIDSPFGKVKFTIPVSVKNGDVIVIVGEGLYKDSTKSMRGDLRVMIVNKQQTIIEKIMRRFFGK